MLCFPVYFIFCDKHRRKILIPMLARFFITDALLTEYQANPISPYAAGDLRQTG
jgi:hypothetical protein